MKTKSCGVGSLSKPENSNNLLGDENLSAYDFVITTDDDIKLPPHFLDDLIAIMELSSLDIAGPAHRIQSFRNFEITKRQSRSLARLTNYVEVGPLVVFRNTTYSALLPFPVNRYGWGIDLLWSTIAVDYGWRLGIVDATPIRHLSPAGTNYNWEAALLEMEAFRAENNVTFNVYDQAVLSHELPI